MWQPSAPSIGRQYYIKYNVSAHVSDDGVLITNILTILDINHRVRFSQTYLFRKWRFPSPDTIFFKVCEPVHQRTIQINHQPDATVFQFIILTFIYSSTCFGRFPAHHQELDDCSGSLWFYLRFVVIVVLCSRSGRPDREHSTTVTTKGR